VLPALRTRSSFLGAVPAPARPLLALAGVLLLDLVQTAHGWPLLVLGLLDEPAHLLTAWLVLAAATARTTALRCTPWVLAGSVLLDLDHVPLFLGLDVAATPGGRPVTHSLSTVLVLLAAAGVVRRWRVALAGLAAGAATQLLRDLSTGPGVPLLWPLAHGDVRLPYWSYLLVLAVLTAVALARRVRRTRFSAGGGAAGTGA
jgi:inner membrane protein